MATTNLRRLQGQIALEPADFIPADATAVALTECRFVKAVTGGKGNRPLVAVCGAGERAIGVIHTSYKASANDVRVIAGNQVVEVTAGGAIVAGAEVQSDAQGRAVTLAAGKPLGVAFNDTAAAGDRVFVKLSV